jgi:hypothetical protein
MSNKNILPCLECGGEDVFIHERYRLESITGKHIEKSYWIECRECGEGGEWSYSLEDAISEWNFEEA